MKTTDQTWQKLAEAARHAPDARDTTAPFGFTGRVVARARQTTSAVVSPWDVLSLRSLALAVLVMLVSVGWSFQSVADQLTAAPMAPVELMALIAQE